jgi:hypothetical protein
VALGCLSLGYQVALGGFARLFRTPHSALRIRPRVFTISLPNTTRFPRLPRGGLGAPWTNPGHALVPWNPLKTLFLISQAYLFQRFTGKAQGSARGNPAGFSSRFRPAAAQACRSLSFRWIIHGRRSRRPIMRRYAEAGCSVSNQTRIHGLRRCCRRVNSDTYMGLVDLSIGIGGSGGLDRLKAGPARMLFPGPAGVAAVMPPGDLGAPGDGQTRLVCLSSISDEPLRVFRRWLR